MAAAFHRWPMIAAYNYKTFLTGRLDESSNKKVNENVCVYVYIYN